MGGRHDRGPDSGAGDGAVCRGREGGGGALDAAVAVPVRRPVVVLAAIAAAFISVTATVSSWAALADRRAFDLPLRCFGAAGIVTGLVVWSRGRRSTTGQLVTATAVGLFVRDFRASTDPTLFRIGFWFGFLWLATAAHVILSWPTGRSPNRGTTALVAVGYVVAAGTQIARYAADRPRPGWLYDHPPSTLWAHVGSAAAGVFAVAVAVAVVRRWARSGGTERPSEPVWLVFVVVAVTSAAATVASIAGVPDGQIELIPSALAVTMLVPAGWVYLRMRAQLEDVRASRKRLETAALEERRRIQHDLHDGAQQGLDAVQLRLEDVLDLLDRAGAAADPAGGGAADPVLAPAREQIRKAAETLEVSAESLHDLVQGLYPSVLRDYGLRAALEKLADHSTVPLVLDVEVPPSCAERVLIAAYFVVQEAVGNSVRHAGPDLICVRARLIADELVIEVADDGNGAALPLELGGLRSLRDRAETVGGNVTLSSEPSAGTRVTIRLPRE